VSFNALSGNVPELTLASSSLTGTGADVSFDTLADGQVIGGTWTLEFGGHETVEMAHDATDAEVQSALQSLPSIESVQVTRGSADDEGGYAWTVVFDGDLNTGDLPALTYTSSLTGNNPVITVCTSGDAAGLCSGYGGSSDGAYLAGTFTLSDGTPSAAIAWNADVPTFKAALEGLASISADGLHVSRTGPGRNGEYTWRVAYTADAGNINALTADASGLSGAYGSEDVEVVTVHDGTVQEVQQLVLDNAVSGMFGLSLDSHPSAPIAVVAGSCSGTASNIADALQAVAFVGTVSVGCNNGATSMVFDIEFSSKAGDLADLVVHTSDPDPVVPGLTGTGGLTPAAFTVTELVAGTGVPVGGSFALSFRGQRTGYIAADASAVEVQAELEELSTVGSVSV
jgi:hypothetical protein